MKYNLNLQENNVFLLIVGRHSKICVFLNKYIYHVTTKTTNLNVLRTELEEASKSNLIQAS